MSLKKLIIYMVAAAAIPALARAADTSRVNVVLECQCTDAVGAELCDSTKNAVLKSPIYHLQDSARDYGFD